MSDELQRDLLVRFVHDDLEAFEALFRLFEAEVYRWILRIVRDDGTAEDVLVEAFWRAYRGRARFDPSRSFGAWMRRIATNVACDHLRSTRRWLARSSEGGRVQAPPAPAGDVREAVALAFGRLPPRLRVVATLALVEEQPYAEIAEALGLPIGTVKSRVSRALRVLRKELMRLGVQP